MSTQERIRIVLDTVGTTALVITAAVLVWTATSRRPGEAAGAEPGPTAGLTESIDTTIGRTGHVMGSQQAKLAIVGFSDFQCPYCERFAQETLPQLKREFIDPGIAQFIYRHNPLESIHRLALRASVAADCADQQSQFWGMHDAIFSNQRELVDTSFVDYARTLRLDADVFSKCLDGGTTPRIKEDQADVVRLGLQSTPIFLIGRIESNGTIKVTKRINGAAPYETFTAALKALL